jgi:hypothetical protein
VLLAVTACILLAIFDKAGERRAVNKEEPKEKETFGQILLSLLQVFRFPVATWFIYFICVFFYVGTFPFPRLWLNTLHLDCNAARTHRNRYVPLGVLTFYTVASDIMQKTGTMYSEDIATLFISIPNFVSVIASPSTCPSPSWCLCDASTSFTHSFSLP